MKRELVIKLVRKECVMIALKDIGLSDTVVATKVYMLATSMTTLEIV